MSERRSEYRPGSAQEEFIVPLLRKQIEENLSCFATSHSVTKKALDVGCGEQPLRLAIEAMGYTYTGFDVQQNRARSVSVTGRIDDTLPSELLNLGTFDFILCTEVLEHVADWPRAFENFRTLLAPGGRMLVTCPHFYHLHEEPHDYWRPTPYALRYFGQRMGFRLLHQENVGNGWDVLGTALACSRPVPQSGGLSQKALVYGADMFRKCLYLLFRTRFLQRHVALRGSLYLSNIAVFEKATESG